MFKMPYNRKQHQTSPYIGNIVNTASKNKKKDKCFEGEELTYHTTEDKNQTEQETYYAILVNISYSTSKQAFYPILIFFQRRCS